jgi:signal transduction histidine kinase
MSDRSSILIIDDELIARATLEALLEDQPYQVHFAENGEEGLAKAENINPDLIICDVMMPGMSGFEVCHSLRTHPVLAEVPIIILSALDDSESRLKGLEAGADDFLNKPFDRSELLIRLRTILRLNRFRHIREDREKLARAYEQLEAQNNRLKELSQELLTTHEDERRLLAIELHDEIGQQLTGLKLLLEINSQHDQTEMESRLARARELVAELLSHVREISLDLRPTILDDLGICAALDWLFKRFTHQTGIEILNNINPMNPVRFNRTLEITLFRMVQEALTNIARYAQVRSANVTLTIDEHDVQVVISDQGVGFDPRSLETKKSTGLSGMRERVLLAGGNFDLYSIPNEGTRIQADFPLS